MATPACPACGFGLSLRASAGEANTARSARAISPPSQSVAFQSSKDQAMDQARNYVCRECSTSVPSGHKFCGTCGAAVPPEVVEMRINYFGSMQTPGKARLILIRGDSGVDGLSYMLQGTEHIAGRDDGQILFPEDSWLSARHANFLYQNGKLVVRDEQSFNGVYVRVRDSASLSFGDTFLCGEQMFRLEPPPEDTAAPGADQTYFYSSPRKQYTFRVVQILAGGGKGLVFCASGPSAEIGREDCDLNFPTDVYMSGAHAKIELGGDGNFKLVDQGSKNGSYLKVNGQQPLVHGDYLFLGKQLLRVEMTA
jgi:pSer/pThr/pTyr-binding forkhead associated (FHA) protein